MIAPRVLSTWIALLCAGALAACSSDVASTSETTTTTTTTTGPGGGGGAGGAGGGGNTTSSGGGQGPIACSGSHSTVPEGQCDLLQQDCPPGQTCEPSEFNGNWSTRCRTSNGLKGAGVPCFGATECAAGLFCVDVSGVCSPICCPDNGDPCGGGQCIVESGYGPYFTMMCAFDPACDLFQPDACEGGRQCHVTDGVQGLATCVAPSSQPAGEGEACSYLNDCGDMQHCEGNLCRYYCLLDAAPGTAPGLGGCPGGQACAERDYGIQGVGICQP
ncbi:MAG TPA: hypothetical protein VLS89_15020 [Candidatus Nanopelagicales bacterium]|nr:hypothetical protein [Candidatus Nanopelagicales bacterium]